MTSQQASSSASQGGSSRSMPPASLSLLTHYQLLEVSPEVSAPALRQAFRSLSKRYHPDTTALPPSEAREAFARLRQAYAVLADPESRRAYDAQLQRPPSPPPVVPPLPTGPVAAARPIGVRRSLSGGEWFALVLLGLALALSLVLGVGLAWARGAALVTRPSWWTEATALTAQASSAADPLQAADGAAAEVAAAGPRRDPAPLPSDAVPPVGGISQAPLIHPAS